MSVQKVIFRSVSLAAIAAGGLAGAVHFELGTSPGRAQATSVVLTAGEAPTVSAPVVIDDTAELAPPPVPAPIPVPEPPAPQIALEPLAEEPEIARSALGLPCGLSLTATAMPGALVALDIMEPCAPDARVTVTHGALTFAGQTDAMGLLTLDIPALETPAFFTVRIEDGAEATTMTGLPDLVDYDRVAITWDEDRGLQLHAFEGGAEFGGTGHVWQEASGSVAAATGGTGGFLTLLGDASLASPQLAQVYTVPRALRDDLALSVEVPVTEDNCARAVRAQTIARAPGGEVTAQPVSFVVPGCDAVGEYLLLQNLFQDLRLASN